jgi:heat shock protein HtpX
MRGLKQMVKRIFLFVAVNILIMLTISIVLNLLGVQPYLTAQGINYQSLAAFCLVWGFGGAFISLALSRIMAKWMMGVKLVNPNGSPEERWLHETVSRIAGQAGLPQTPEVGMFNSPAPNAFATGPTKRRSLVAVSTGLLRGMNKAEIEGVLAHEVAHIANGDMVTMTLLQGVVNAFVMFFARIAAFAISQTVREEQRSLVHFFCVIAFEIVFSLLGMMVVAAFSRHREFRADRGSAGLVGKEKMVAALQNLQRFTGVQAANQVDDAMAVYQIAGRPKGGLMALFATHPDLSDRIKALQTA